MTTCIYRIGFLSSLSTFALSLLMIGSVAAQKQSVNPASAEEYYLLARKYLEESDALVLQIDKWRAKRKEALSALNKAVELEPDNMLYVLERARLLVDDGDTVLALREFNKLIANDPNDAELYALRAEIYETEGIFDKAITDRDKIVSLRPNDPAGYTGRAGTFVRNNKHPEAVEDYSRALRLDPRYAPALEGRALSYELLGDLAKALTDRTTLVNISPTNERYFHLVHRANIYERTRQLAKAVDDLTEAVRLAPDIPEPYELRARIYRLMGKTAIARQDELKAKRLWKK